MNGIKVKIYIDEKQWEVLRKLAFKKRTSRSALVREAIKKVYKV